MVTIELWPHGQQAGKRVLGVAEIANLGTGTLESGNYEVRLLKWGEGRRVWKKGQVLNFPRQRLGPYDLLFRALLHTVGLRNAATPDEGAKIRELEARAAAPVQAQLFDGGAPQGKPGHAV